MADAEEPRGRKKKRRRVEAKDKDRWVVEAASEGCRRGPAARCDGAADGTSPRGRGRGAGWGREGGLTTKAPASSRPSSLQMLRPRPGGRKHTVSVALPASIVENAKSGEVKAMLVGQVARALTIFSVDEVVLYEDQSGAPPSGDTSGVSRSLAFFARNLQYLETPQYLRRQLMPMHRDLKWVGLLSPLDAPHHLRKHEHLAYREGAVLSCDIDGVPKKPPHGSEGEVGCWASCGLDSPVWVAGQDIPPNIRVTVRLDEASADDDVWRGVAVAPDEPRTRLGLYWGYQTRIASSLKAVFEECPFEGGYDFSIGTSERGEVLGMSRLPPFRHLILAFGGVGGFEEVILDELSGYSGDTDPASLFSRYVNVCPGQTSRTIRTEEAVMIALSALKPHLPER